ncbi:MAG: hypothetical protein AAB481_02775 [Patescibacteria group bacterium]
MTPDDIRQQIELKVVEFLRKVVTEGTMTEERSQAIAKLVLTHLTPGMSWAQLYKAIPKLDDASQEISPIIVPYLREYEDRIAQAAEKTVREYIHLGKYDAAINLAKKVINQEVDLVWTASAKPTTKPS